MKIKIESPGEVELLKPTIERMLDNGTIEIVFVKASGEIREMLCTTNPALIVSASGTLATPSTAKRVFDVKKQAWRSFKWDSLKKVKLG